MRHFLTWIVLLLSALGCQEGTKCDEHAECHDKSTACFCNDKGQLFRELRDVNGDGRGDSVRYTRDEAGRVLQIASDWGDNGSVERLQLFGYDAAGNRTTNEGWLEQCADKKFKWSCKYETPCPAPYDKCARCKKKYVYENEDGDIEPCGKQPKSAPK
jgi:hypothetical protein